MLFFGSLIRAAKPVRSLARVTDDLPRISLGRFACGTALAMSFLVRAVGEQKIKGIRDGRRRVLPFASHNSK